MVFFISAFQLTLKPKELYQTEEIDFCPLHEEPFSEAVLPKQH